MMPFRRASIATCALLAVSTATSSWCQVPDRSVPAVESVVQTAVHAADDGAVQIVPARPASLISVPDQKPKRMEPVRTLDHPERLNATLVALGQAPKTDFVKSSDPAPKLARPALPAWTPDDLGDIPITLERNRLATKAQAR